MQINILIPHSSFDEEYADMSIEGKVNVMESFARILFLCNCPDAFSGYACEHSVATSMLWNTELKLSDVERADQLKAKEKVKAANPFNAAEEEKEKEGKKWETS
jgi:hypothetical protein